MPDDTDDGLPTPEEDPAGEQLPLVELETVLTRKPSRRKRLAQLGLVLLAGIVALVTFRGTLFPQRALPLAPTQAAPTQLPLLSPALLILSNLTYGSIVVNGRKHQELAPFFVPLAGETYDLTLIAPPFRAVSCHVNSPPLPAPGEFSTSSRAGHCTALRYGTTGSLGFKNLHGVYGDPRMLITINVTADDLPPDQQSQVASLLTQTLTSQQETTVPQDQYIATSASPDGSVTSQRAREPLQARAFIAPGTPSLQLATTCSERICPAVLSPYVPSFSLPTSPLWAVEVPMGLRWRFTSASGEVIGDVSFPAERFLAVFLSYDPKGGWQVFQQEVVPGYDTLQNQFSAVFCSAESQLPQSLQQSNGFVEVEHDHGIAGCEVSLQHITAAQPITTSDLGHFVLRFGALLAADDNAHALLPNLPIASPEEIAAVGG